MRHLFTSESVTEGHPDKLCDAISDAVLDEMLRGDKNSRVACECIATTGLVLIVGEITTECYVDINKTARDTIREIGYTRAKYGFDAETCGIMISIDEQSPDIALGVDRSLEEKLSGTNDGHGAGDQGLMFGFACDQTETLMPAPIFYAHSLAKRLAKVRKDGVLDYLRPDGKTQVTVEYDGDKPIRIDTVVVSAQHKPEAEHDQIERDIIEKVIMPTLPGDLLDDKLKIYVNPTGRFVEGGPKGDSGLTGRKIIVDTYGGYARHGGGAFSGKDPSKVDRSAAYMARYAAKNIVAAGLARQCEIQVAYAIGVARPVSIAINTSGTGKYGDDKLAQLAAEKFDFRPDAIIDLFDLKRPIYSATSAYGHFGRTDITFPWEEINENLF
ncbi:MAG: methionine adenosyltransferase [Eubacteriales bacterium]|nr:methionine adenosyltransferase [Eubacteriales bacterium]